MALLGGLLVVISGCGTTTADTARGRELFKQKCGVCHALAQAGTTAEVGPDLDDAFAAAREVGEDANTIEGVVRAQVEFPRPNTGHSINSMPPDIVSGQDLNDVAAYVGEWAGVPGAKPPEVAGGPGAQVFANNGCATCHTLAAAGATGTTGPDLDEVLPGKSAEKIEEDIVEPNKEIAKGYPANVMPQNFGETIPANELEELIAYLQEVAGKEKG
ncbi:MAG: c-type cytochrome [Actinobacteria bacterium]|nr:c-type cytochrome [Actinomycetota bacterium]